MNERTLFLRALAITDPAARADYLQKECANDAALRQRVEALLKAHDEAGRFLEEPAADAGATGAYTRPVDDNAEGHKGIGQPSSQTRTMEGPGTRIGPYKLLQQIGEGGMGTVFMAEQLDPVRRKVALKIIKPGMDSKEVLARFEAERQALALMDHPNIAKVLEADTTDQGRPYFVMELVKGIPITKYCDEQQLTPRERLELFMPVCQAIQHAHQKGVIHRDIKPSNVLVATYDGRPVPKVIDFGVAKAMGQQLTEKTLFTAFGGVIGTLEYMSPEQAELNALDIDTRSDVYGLGVLLYELLTGTTPLLRKRLKQAALNEALRLIREEEPPKPSTRLSTSEALPSLSAQRKTEPAKLSKMMRGELDWIVMKALEKDRTRRYETASGFAADVQRYLQDEQVLARPTSASYRLRKFARRNKGPLAAAAFVLLALVAGVIGTTWGLFEARYQRDDAQQARDAERDRAGELAGALKKTEQAEQAEKQRAGELTVALQKTIAAEKAESQRSQELKNALQVSDRSLNNARILLAQSAWDQNSNIDVANNYLDLVPPAFRHFEWRYLKAKYQSWLFTLHGLTDRILSVAFNSDGTRIIGCPYFWLVQTWDARSGQPLSTLKAGTSQLTCVAFSPDGSRIAGSADRMVRVWDAKSGKLLHELIGHTNSVNALAFSADGSRIASGSNDATVLVWDAISGEVLLELRGHKSYVTSVAFSPDGSRIASGSNDNTVRIWKARSGEEIHELKLHTGRVNCVAFSGDGTRIASGSFDKTVRVWDMGGKTLFELKGHTDSVLCVAFSGDGSHIASGSRDKAVRVWETANGEALMELKGHTDIVTSLAFSPDASRIASGSWDKTVKIWTLTRQRVRELNLKSSFTLQSVAFNPALSGLISSSLYGYQLWNSNTGDEIMLGPIKPLSETISIAFSPDGHRVAGGSVDKSVRIWDSSTGEMLMELKGHTEKVLSVKFSSDGNYLVSGSFDKTLRVWNAGNGKAISEFKGHSHAVGSVDISPDSRRIASGSYDNTVSVWDVKSGERLREIKAHTGPIKAVAFCPDGRHIASCGDYPDNTIRIWDAETGQISLELIGHFDGVISVAFSADGNRLVSGSRDKTVRIWDAKTGQALLVLRGHSYDVTSVAFSPDGNQLASAGFEGELRVWDVSQIRTEHSQGTQLSRPDPQWHVARREEFEKENNTFAAAFHRSWEQQARGVLAFEACDFDRAWAHFIAAAALKPKPSEIWK